jgi:hypothetical protein
MAVLSQEIRNFGFRKTKHDAAADPTLTERETTGTSKK